MSGMMGAETGAMEAAEPPGALDDLAGVIAQAAAGAEIPRMMRRDVPEPTEARRRLCGRMQRDVASAKEYWRPQFDRMRTWQQLARDGSHPEWKSAGLYVANMCLNHVQTKTARLYARNPTIRVDRRPSMDFKLWDGSPEMVQAAAIDPIGNAELILDIQQGSQRRKLLSGVARTLQLIAKHQLDQVRPPFKQKMKALVTRTTINGVAYVKLGYERQMQPAPETVAGTSNQEARVAHIERLQADLHDPEANADADSAEAEELRLALGELQGAPLVVTDEGLRFDFPAPTAIIPDKGCVDLHGFEGCDVVTEEFAWSVAQVQEMFGVDVRGAGTKVYTDAAMSVGAPYSSTSGLEADDTTSRLRVWCAYQRKTGLVYWMVEGYPDFLSEPAPPPILLARFWPWFAITFNPADAIPGDKNVTCYPPSDIELIRYMQDEYNRARQALRDHRIAGRPKYALPRGYLQDKDKTNLTTADAHSIVELDGLQPNQKIEDVLQIVRHPGIDPNMYDVQQTATDMQRVTGMQGADAGAVSGATATEVSRAANATDQGAESNIDDMNNLLSELMNEAGRVLLLEMDPATAARIAGPGAVWPTIPSADVYDMVYLDIQAGSSGRPNKAAEIQAFERLAPILLQIPGIKPIWLAKEAIRRLDDNIDVADAVLDGLPSIMAMMAAQKATAAAPPGPQGPGAAQGAVGGGPQGEGGQDNAPRPGGAVSQGPAQPAPEAADVVAGRGGEAMAGGGVNGGV